MATQTLTREIRTACDVRSWAAAPTADGVDVVQSPAGRSATVAPRTEAGRRALQRRRARVTARRRPPSGVLPSSNRTSAVVTADRGDEVDRREFRLGRWSRLACTVSLLGTAVILAVVLLSAGTAEVVGQVTVATGDTLWSIAQEADPGADTGAVVARIRNLNGLTGDSITAGAVLEVPISGR